MEPAVASVHATQGSASLGTGRVWLYCASRACHRLEGSRLSPAVLCLAGRLPPRDAVAQGGEGL